MAFVDIGGICLDDLGDVPSSDKRTMGVSQEDSSHSQDVVCDLHQFSQLHTSLLGIPRLKTFCQCPSFCFSSGFQL